MKTGDFLDSITDTERQIVDKIDPSGKDYEVALAARRLAIAFTEDAELPARYRKSATISGKARKVKEESEIEKRFKANVDAWRQLIETMLAKINESQAWRFVNLSPRVDNMTEKVTENKDFSDFADYLVLRRDRESCSPKELGGLAMLLTSFQRAVEKRIQSTQAGTIFEPAGAGDALQPS